VTVGERLRFLMIERGVSIKGLASKIGVNRSTIGDWRADRTTPRPDTFVLCLQALGVTLAEFMQPVDPPPNSWLAFWQTFSGATGQEFEG